MLSEVMTFVLSGYSLQFGSWDLQADPFAIACKRNTLQLGIFQKNTIHPNSMPATICLMIATTTKTSWMRL